MFLDQTQALGKIRSLLRESNHSRLAVAFWGDGAIERLGLDTITTPIEILCNVESGCCNPKELERLSGLPNVTLKTNRRLHGKVYWTNEGAVLGSSNASTNGLAIEGKPLTGWHEANFFTQASGSLAEIASWLDERMHEAINVTPSALLAATAKWKARSRMAPLDANGASLLETVRLNPGHPAWNALKVVYWSDGLSEQAEAAIAIKRQEGSAFAQVSAYESWGDSLAGGDWILDMAVTGARAEFGGYWHALDIASDDGWLQLVTEGVAVDLPAIGRLKLSQQEKKILARATSWALEDKLGGDRNAVVMIEDVAAWAA